MIAEKLQLAESPYTAPNFEERELYPLNWKHSSAKDVPDLTGLPSIDHALYLFNTVKFHLGQTYRFFEDESFTETLQKFYYGSALEKASECRLWFVEFLLVLAFGKAFLSPSRRPGNPPGSNYFVRAMSLMPDHATLWKDSLLAMEVLALAGLYLYCVDQRESALVYVSGNGDLLLTTADALSLIAWPGNTHSAIGRTAYTTTRERARYGDRGAMPQPLVDPSYHGSPFFDISGATDDDTRKRYLHGTQTTEFRVTRRYDPQPSGQPC